MSSSNPPRTFELDGPQLENFPLIKIPILFETKTAIIQYEKGRTVLIIPDDDKDKENPINIASGIVTSFRLQKSGWIEFKSLPYVQPTIEDSKTPFTIETPEELGEIQERFKHIEKIVLNKEKDEPYFRLALRRFNRSYNDEFKEDVLIDLMICFEILFVKGLEKGKSACLKERVGNFLGYKKLIDSTKTPIPSIQEDFERASWLRNCIVHEGKQYNLVFERYNQLAKRDPRSPWDFLLMLRDYARKSLQGYIQCIMKDKYQTTKEVKTKICDKWKPRNLKYFQTKFPCS